MKNLKIPKPNDYMQSLFTKYLQARLIGNHLESEKQHCYMAMFASSMGRSKTYHLKRLGERG